MPFQVLTIKNPADYAVQHSHPGTSTSMSCRHHQETSREVSSTHRPSIEHKRRSRHRHHETRFHCVQSEIGPRTAKHRSTIRHVQRQEPKHQASKNVDSVSDVDSFQHNDRHRPQRRDDVKDVVGVRSSQLREHNAQHKHHKHREIVDCHPPNDLRRGSHTSKVRQVYKKSESRVKEHVRYEQTILVPKLNNSIHYRRHGEKSQAHHYVSEKQKLLKNVTKNSIYNAWPVTYPTPIEYLSAGAKGVFDKIKKTLNIGNCNQDEQNTTKSKITDEKSRQRNTTSKISESKEPKLIHLSLPHRTNLEELQNERRSDENCVTSIQAHGLKSLSGVTPNTSGKFPSSECFVDKRQSEEGKRLARKVGRHKYEKSVDTEMKTPQNSRTEQNVSTSNDSDGVKKLVSCAQWSDEEDFAKICFKDFLEYIKHKRGRTRHSPDTATSTKEDKKVALEKAFDDEVVKILPTNSNKECLDTLPCIKEDSHSFTIDYSSWQAMPSTTIILDPCSEGAKSLLDVKVDSSRQSVHDLSKNKGELLSESSRSSSSSNNESQHTKMDSECIQEKSDVRGDRSFDSLGPRQRSDTMEISSTSNNIKKEINKEIQNGFLDEIGKLSYELIRNAHRSSKKGSSWSSNHTKSDTNNKASTDSLMNEKEDHSPKSLRHRQHTTHLKITSRGKYHVTGDCSSKGNPNRFSDAREDFSSESLRHKHRYYKKLSARRTNNVTGDCLNDRAVDEALSSESMRLRHRPRRHKKTKRSPRVQLAFAYLGDPSDEEDYSSSESLRLRHSFKKIPRKRSTCGMVDFSAESVEDMPRFVQVMPALLEDAPAEKPQLEKVQLSREVPKTKTRKGKRLPVPAPRKLKNVSTPAQWSCSRKNEPLLRRRSASRELGKLPMPRSRSPVNKTIRGASQVTKGKPSADQTEFDKVRHVYFSRDMARLKKRNDLAHEKAKERWKKLRTKQSPSDDDLFQSRGDTASLPRMHIRSKYISVDESPESEGQCPQTTIPEPNFKVEHVTEKRQKKSVNRNESPQKLDQQNEVPIKPDFVEPEKTLELSISTEGQKCKLELAMTPMSSLKDLGRIDFSEEGLGSLPKFVQLMPSSLMNMQECQQPQTLTSDEFLAEAEEKFDVRVEKPTASTVLLQTTALLLERGEALNESLMNNTEVNFGEKRSINPMGQKDKNNRTENNKNIYTSILGDYYNDTDNLTNHSVKKQAASPAGKTVTEGNAAGVTVSISKSKLNEVAGFYLNSRGDDATKSQGLIQPTDGRPTPKPRDMSTNSVDTCLQAHNIKTGDSLHSNELSKNEDKNKIENVTYKECEKGNSVAERDSSKVLLPNTKSHIKSLSSLNRVLEIKHVDSDEHLSTTIKTGNPIGVQTVFAVPKIDKENVTCVDIAYEAGNATSGTESDTDDDDLKSSKITEPEAGDMSDKSSETDSDDESARTSADECEGVTKVRSCCSVPSLNSRRATDKTCEMTPVSRTLLGNERSQILSGSSATSSASNTSQSTNDSSDGDSRANSLTSKRSYSSLPCKEVNKTLERVVEVSEGDSDSPLEYQTYSQESLLSSNGLLEDEGAVDQTVLPRYDDLISNINEKIRKNTETAMSQKWKQDNPNRIACTDSASPLFPRKGQHAIPVTRTGSSLSQVSNLSLENCRTSSDVILHEHRGPIVPRVDTHDTVSTGHVIEFKTHGQEMRSAAGNIPITEKVNPKNVEVRRNNEVLPPPTPNKDDTPSGTPLQMPNISYQYDFQGLHLHNLNVLNTIHQSKQDHSLIRRTNECVSRIKEEAFKHNSKETFQRNLSTIITGSSSTQDKGLINELNELDHALAVNDQPAVPGKSLCNTKILQTITQTHSSANGIQYLDPAPEAQRKNIMQVTQKQHNEDLFKARNELKQNVTRDLAQFPRADDWQHFQGTRQPSENVRKPRSQNTQYLTVVQETQDLSKVPQVYNKCSSPTGYHPLQDRSLVRETEEKLIPVTEVHNKYVPQTRYKPTQSLTLERETQGNVVKFPKVHNRHSSSVRQQPTHTLSIIREAQEDVVQAPKVNDQHVFTTVVNPIQDLSTIKEMQDDTVRIPIVNNTFPFPTRNQSRSQDLSFVRETHKDLHVPTVNGQRAFSTVVNPIQDLSVKQKIEEDLFRIPTFSNKYSLPMTHQSCKKEIHQDVLQIPKVNNQREFIMVVKPLQDHRTPIAREIQGDLVRVPVIKNNAAFPIRNQAIQDLSSDWEIRENGAKVNDTQVLTATVKPLQDLRLAELTTSQLAGTPNINEQNTSAETYQQRVDTFTTRNDIFQNPTSGLERHEILERTPQTCEQSTLENKQLCDARKSTKKEQSTLDRSKAKESRGEVEFELRDSGVNESLKEFNNQQSHTVAHICLDAKRNTSTIDSLNSGKQDALNSSANSQDLTETSTSSPSRPKGTSKKKKWYQRIMPGRRPNRPATPTNKPPSTPTESELSDSPSLRTIDRFLNSYSTIHDIYQNTTSCASHDSANNESESGLLNPAIIQKTPKHNFKRYPRS